MGCLQMAMNLCASGLLLCAAAVLLVPVAPVRAAMPSHLNLSFTPMGVDTDFGDPMSLTVDSKGTVYFADTGGVSFIRANESRASILYLSNDAPWMIWVGANQAAAAPNQIFAIDVLNNLYRLNTSSQDYYAATQIEITFDEYQGALYRFDSFTFVNGTLMSIVNFFCGYYYRTALMLLQFESDLDTKPTGHFLPIARQDSFHFQSSGSNFVPTRAGDFFISDSGHPNTVYRLTGSDIRTAMAASKPGRWGANVTATPVLSGAVAARGAAAMRAADVMPVVVDGRDLLLLSDEPNAAVLLWDPAAPLVVGSNPLSFPVTAGGEPLCFVQRWGTIYLTMGTTAPERLHSNWLRIHGLTDSRNTTQDIVEQ